MSYDRLCPSFSVLKNLPQELKLSVPEEFSNKPPTPLGPWRAETLKPKVTGEIPSADNSQINSNDWKRKAISNHASSPVSQVSIWCHMKNGYSFEHKPYRSIIQDISSGMKKTREFVSVLHHPDSMTQTDDLEKSMLRSHLRTSRTEIAMAVHDPFPLLYGLADHDIISDQLLEVRLKILSSFLLKVSHKAPVWGLVWFEID